MTPESSNFFIRSATAGEEIPTSDAILVFEIFELLCSTFKIFTFIGSNFISKNLLIKILKILNFLK
jgi:hypothetical protein